MTEGAIATPHVQATEAGRDALAAGGNAIDAALVAAAVLTVVYPHQCAIGGDLFALVHTAAGETFSVNGSGYLPKSVDVERLRGNGFDLPANGPQSLTVPGMVAGWNSIAELGGSFAPADVLASAIELAAGGMEVSSSLAAGIRAQSEVLAKDEGMRNVFFRRGIAVQEGERIRQTALSRTLAALAKDGFDSFYAGEIAERLVGGLRSLGAEIGNEDLLGHRSEINTPLTYRYGEVELATSPPNSQGLALLQACVALDAIGIGMEELGEFAGEALCASLMAADDRDRYLGDPRHADVPLDELFDGARLERRLQRRLRQDAPRSSAGTAVSAHGDTVAVCAMDGDGNAVSLIQSVYQTFGAGILEADTGIIMHNRARGFSLVPGEPNEMIPGTRPAHTLMPLLLLRDGIPVASLGTMGGRAQPQILLQILPGTLDTTASDLAAGLAAPRWVFGGPDIGFDEPTVALEADAPAAMAQKLALARLPVIRVSARDERMGHANVVRIASDGRLECASDPRSDGLGLTV